MSKIDEFGTTKRFEARRLALPEGFREDFLHVQIGAADSVSHSNVGVRDTQRSLACVKQGRLVYCPFHIVRGIPASIVINLTRCNTTCRLGFMRTCVLRLYRILVHEMC